MMCLCIEDMLHASCSDCSQNNAEFTVTLDVDANGFAAVAATDELHKNRWQTSNGLGGERIMTNIIVPGTIHIAVQ